MSYDLYGFDQLEVGHNIFDYEKSYINLFLDHIYIKDIYCDQLYLI